MAGSYGFKQADQLTAKYLNDVNDANAGGTLVSVPAGAPQAAVSATQPGDRIILDDATALALSDTSVGTLYGGVYVYMGTYASSTASPARGAIAFTRTADIGVTYQVDADALPSAAVPTAIFGIFINAITKGNWGWVQTAGVASVLFDSAVTGAADGALVSSKISATVASTADSDAFAATYAAANANVTVAGIIGVAMGLPAVSTISKVSITRSPFCRV